MLRDKLFSGSGNLAPFDSNFIFVRETIILKLFFLGKVGGCALLCGGGGECCLVVI